MYGSSLRLVTLMPREAIWRPATRRRCPSRARRRRHPLRTRNASSASVSRISRRVRAAPLRKLPGSDDGQTGRASSAAGEPRVRGPGGPAPSGPRSAHSGGLRKTPFPGRCQSRRRRAALAAVARTDSSSHRSATAISRAPTNTSGSRARSAAGTRASCSRLFSARRGPPRASRSRSPPRRAAQPRACSGSLAASSGPCAARLRPSAPRSSPSAQLGALRHAQPNSVSRAGAAAGHGGIRGSRSSSPPPCGTRWRLPTDERLSIRARREERARDLLRRRAGAR